MIHKFLLFLFLDWNTPILPEGDLWNWNINFQWIGLQKLAIFFYWSVISVDYFFHSFYHTNLMFEKFIKTNGPIDKIISICLSEIVC